MDYSDIINKIPERFDNAVKTGDLLFFPSTTTKHIESNIEVGSFLKNFDWLWSYSQYEIRVCPALQHKDSGSAAHGNRGKVYDPFAPPYNMNLYVGEMRDDESQEEFVVLVGHIA